MSSLTSDLPEFSAIFFCNSLSVIFSKIMFLTFALSSSFAISTSLSSLEILFIAAILTSLSESVIAIFLRVSSFVSESFKTAFFRMTLSLALKIKSDNISSSWIFSRASFLYFLSFALIAISFNVSSSSTLLKISVTCSDFFSLITTSAMDLLFSPNLSYAKLLTS